MFKQIAAAAAVTTTLGFGASAQIFGELIQTEDGVAVVEGFAQLNADVYTFDVTNSSGQDIFAFDAMVFTVSGGTLLQGANFSSSSPVLDFNPFVPPDGALVADSFFVAPDPATPGVNVDTDSELSATAIANLGSPYIVDGATATVAVLVVTEGATIDFNFGDATGVNALGETIGPVVEVPEPASLALAAAGLAIAGLRRRRA
ncbi:MAG: PEP-CTERM sorting domain-containing protein [Planctomycetota bacterium]